MTETALAPYEGRTSSLSERERRRWVELMKPAAELASSIAGTDFVPKSIRHNPAAIAACILYGDEVGLGPMQSLAKIAVIDGRPALYAEACRALILAAGHELWIEEQTTSRVTISGRRRDSQQTTSVTWTMDDARKANLAGRQNFRTYPRQMLAARATTELARLVFADVIGGLGIVEELDAEVSLEGGVPEKPKSRNGDGQRRKREDATLARSSRPTPADDEPRDGPPLPGEPGYGPTPDDEEADTASPSWKKMHATFREKGYEDREARIAFASSIAGRDLTSTKDLTSAEVGRVIDALADVLPSAGESGTGGMGDESTTPQATSQDVPEGLGDSLSLAMFRSRVAAEGITDAEKAEVGHALYPGRSLSALNADELTRFLNELLARKEGREGEGGEDWT